MDVKSRLKNYGMWIGVLALLLLVLDQFGIGFAEAGYHGAVDIILGILALFGIINNPTTNRRGFCDD